ncbi:hypothetical protein VTL71DRAFT_9514 [Oculimacula yallundae]|uniref:Uncharacterized protein n=1 Tax=Oculimacula yallundae TaxID=86028 RepID=A0ABR4BS82_9HELO
MASFWVLKSGMDFGDAQKSLYLAKGFYEAIAKVYAALPGANLAFIIQRFAVSVGLAIIVHLQWRYGEIIEVEMALAYWQAALNAGTASSIYLDNPSFPEMIIKNSICDIAFQLGSHASAATYMHKACILHRTTGRQFQNFALGSI